MQSAQLKPPLQALRDPSYSLIVAKRVDAPVQDQRMRVQVLEDLRGPPTASGEIELLVLPQDDALMVAGKHYLLAYSNVEMVGQGRKKPVRRPDRRELAHIDGANPAVFPDSPEMRLLLSTEHRQIELAAGYRQIVIDSLSTDDAAMADLWSAEMVIRGGTFAQLSKGEIALIERITRDPGYRPATRARLLIAALSRAPNYGEDWYVHAAIEVLQKTRLAQVDSDPSLAQLIDAALLVAQQRPQPKADAIIARWLQAAPPLAEASALALRVIDPSIEKSAVEQAIADAMTPEATRSMLRDYLRRQTLLDGKAQSD